MLLNTMVGLLAAVGWLLGGGLSVASANERIALVIANSDYTHLGVLANPKNDADLITKSLEHAGFTVTKLHNSDLLSLRRASTEFGRRLRTSEAVGVIYYAGHGVQVAGKNYLVPVDANIKDETEVAWQAVDVTELLKLMERKSNSLNIVILDACRDNPFATRFRSASRGLARVVAPRGTFIAYSTAPGEVALDGPQGGNSPYAAALSKMMRRSEFNLETTFKETRREVLMSTGGAQVPWESSSITGEFSFVASVATPLESTAVAALRRQLQEKEALLDQIERQGSSVAAGGASRPSSGEVCDRLAASPHDHSWKGEAVTFARLRASAIEAIQACGRAIVEQPMVDRYKYNLGRAHAAVDGGDTEASHWFRKAAEAYYPAAMNAIGVHLNHGAGVTKDQDEAKEFLRRAAEKGDPVAMANFSGVHFNSMFFAGQGAAFEAVKWARKSAESGDTTGMLLFARLLMFGHGVPRDLDLSKAWLLRAAAKGNAEAYVYLAEQFFFLGRPIEEANRSKVELLRKSASMGNRRAMSDLWNLLNVTSGRDDRREALKWLAAAGKVEDPVRSKQRERIYIRGIHLDEAEMLLNHSAGYGELVLGGRVASSFKLGEIYRVLLREVDADRAEKKQ